MSHEELLWVCFLTLLQPTQRQRSLTECQHVQRSDFCINFPSCLPVPSQDRWLYFWRGTLHLIKTQHSSFPPCDSGMWSCSHVSRQFERAKLVLNVKNCGYNLAPVSISGSLNTIFTFVLWKSTWFLHPAEKILHSKAPEECRVSTWQVQFILYHHLPESKFVSDKTKMIMCMKVHSGVGNIVWQNNLSSKVHALKL